MIGDCILSRVEGSVRSRTMEVRSGALLGQCSGEEEGLAEDGLCFLGMTGEVAFPMRILNEDKTTGGNVPDSPSLVTCSTEPSSRTESTRSGTVCQLLAQTRWGCE
jgi:hypothetical protein